MRTRATSSTKPLGRPGVEKGYVHLFMPRKGRTLEERFWEKVVTDRVGVGCWEWIGALNTDGHGLLWTGPGKPTLTPAHRVVFQIMGAEIPAGMVVDHICRCRTCVNPAHLRFVTPAQNCMENNMGLGATNKAKTHCKRGHEFTPENTNHPKLHPHRRECRACMAMRARGEI